MQLRTKIQEMKKLMPLLCKPLEKIMSVKMSLSEGSVTEEALAKVIKKSRADVDGVCKQMGPYVELLELRGYGEKYCEELKACMVEA
jgi:hypothetical protein